MFKFVQIMYENSYYMHPSKHITYRLRFDVLVRVLIVYNLTL